MNRLLTTLAGMAGLLALSAGPVAAQRDVTAPPDPWIHAATGTSFPAQLVGSQRGQVVEYSEDGRDASVGYSIDKDGYRATVTLYVYPAIPGYTCEETFADARSHIEDYAGAEAVSAGTVQAPSGTGGPVALHARYHVPAGSIREDLPAVRSDIYLYCPPGNEWLVKYRATWSAQADFGGEVETLLHAIEWPPELGG